MVLFLPIVIPFLRIVVGSFNDLLSLFRIVSSIIFKTLLTFLLLQPYRPAHYSLYHFFFSPRFKVPITLLDEFKKASSCTETICASAWTDIPDFVSYDQHLFLFWLSKILRNLNRSKFSTTCATTLTSAFLHFLFLSLWRPYKDLSIWR